MTNLTNVQRCFVGLKSTGLCDDVISYIGKYLPLLTDENIHAAVRYWCKGGKSKENIEEMYGHISDWDVSGVTDMSYMFHGARSFNQPLNKWNVSNVTNMGWMFYYAKSFNQPLNSWDVSNVQSMINMFDGAISFNPKNATWDI